jgi:hypothetical protein
MGKTAGMRRAFIAIGMILAVSFSVFSTPVSAATTTQTPRRPVSVALTLQHIYERAYDEAYSRHAILEGDGTTFVSTRAPR